MQPQSKLLKWSLILGIVIVANLFINYSISLVFSEPQYGDFCGQPSEVLSASQAATCSGDFGDAIGSYERDVFSTLVSVGVILIIVGFMIKTNSVVSSSLALSGVLSLVIASLRYWSAAEGWVKVLLLGMALFALIMLAMRKFKNENLRSQ